MEKGLESLHYPVPLPAPQRPSSSSTGWGQGGGKPDPSPASRSPQASSTRHLTVVHDSPGRLRLEPGSPPAGMPPHPLRTLPGSDPGARGPPPGPVVWPARGEHTGVPWTGVSRSTEPSLLSSSTSLAASSAPQCHLGASRKTERSRYACNGRGHRRYTGPSRKWPQPQRLQDGSLTPDPSVPSWTLAGVIPSGGDATSSKESSLTAQARRDAPQGPRALLLPPPQPHPRCWDRHCAGGWELLEGRGQLFSSRCPQASASWPRWAGHKQEDGIRSSQPPPANSA